MKSKENELVEILQEYSNLIVGIEKIVLHSYMHENGTIGLDSTSTDIWFYCVDPASGHVLERGSPKVQE